MIKIYFNDQQERQVSKECCREVIIKMYFNDPQERPVSKKCCREVMTRKTGK